MSYKVRITAVAPSAKARISHLAELLCKLPGLSKETAIQGLEKPPLDLPEVKTALDAQKLHQGLRRMGLVGEIISIADAPPSPITAPVQTQPTHPTQHLHNLFEDTPQEERHPIELRTEEEDTTQRPGFWRENRALLLLLLGFLFLLGLSFYVQQHFFATEPANTPTSPQASEKQERPQDRQIRHQERQHYEQALKQLAISEQLLRKATRTPDIRKSIALMEKALLYNPYNLEAWQQLAAKYRRIGDEKSAKACNIKYQYSEQTQRMLEGIARYFGGKPKAKINVAQVHYTAQNNTLDDTSFHRQSESLYDTVHHLHPDKEFQMENQGLDTLKMTVLPGDTFPDFDTWESLERKGKTP
ncbi:MAG TPA: hypothetical protein VLM37_10615 [Fibrobacteraceae bacterium]|nr:hypothetical protein [Fibrobacteraceae bacterium]